jgi:magnesium-transporting ATPase (P-type)
MKPKPETGRVYATIIAGMGWLLFLALWLFFYAESYSLIQNLGIFLASLVLVGALIVLLWVPWSMKHEE